VFHCFFGVFLSSLGFLIGGWFGSALVCSRFSGFFVVLFSSLRFLGRGSFVVFFVVGGFGSRSSALSLSGSRWRSGGRSGVSSERSRRETHSSGNNQS